MEASDPFGAGIQAPTDDPFAGADAEFQQGSDPFDAAPPQVDREGNLVVESSVETGVASQEVSAPADPSPAAANGNHPSPSSPESPEAGGSLAQAEPAGEPTRPSEDEALKAWAHNLSYTELEEALAGDLDAPQRAYAQAEMDGRNAGRHSAGAGPTTESTSSEEPGAEDGSDGEATTTAPVPSAADEVAVPVPDEKKDAKTGKVTHRKYLIFRSLGGGKYERVTWHEDEKGRVVPKGTEGAKRRNACLVRSRDDALAVGYMAVGAPTEGAALIAVTAGTWVEKTVAPEPVKPIRSRLKIS